MWKLSIALVGVVAFIALLADTQNPEYIQQCSRSDPELIECLKKSVHHLRPYLAKGIPEIELPTVEPFIMDQLALQLTGGPQGYKVTLKNMNVFGASNFEVKSIKLSEGDEPFEAQLVMPKLTIEAKYTSSGVLIIIPASGGGDFHGVFNGVTADIRGKSSTKSTPKGTFLHIDSLQLNLDVKDVKLSISNVFNNNRILTEATNLFLRENGIEVVRAMQPQLQKKLAFEFGKIANQLLKHVPVENFLRD